MTVKPELAYRECATVDEFHECVRLQKSIWHFDDIDLLPVRLFVVGRKIGGQVFGAFEPGGRMVAFVLALPGIRHGQPYLHSHMLGVLREYRNHGVGRRLKLLQRDDAIRRRLPLIEWTFDPLEPKNAFFNLERLGTVVRRYVPNQYGISSSALHAGLPTDRLVAEWWLSSPRVQRVLGGGAGAENPMMRLAVPPDIDETKKKDPDHALEVQKRLRAGFQKAFDEGLACTGFDKQGAYLFERFEAPQEHA